jgi:hypothetical protein
MLRLETSAKTGENVEQIFIMAAKILYHTYKDKIASMVRITCIDLCFRKKNRPIRKGLGRGKETVCTMVHNSSADADH